VVITTLPDLAVPSSTVPVGIHAILNTPSDTESHSSFGTIGELQREVLENPENHDLAVRLSEAFPARRTSRQHVDDFWTSFVDRNHHFSVPAEKLLAAFNNDQRNNTSFHVLSDRLSFKFPLTDIPRDPLPFLENSRIRRYGGRISCRSHTKVSSSLELDGRRGR
jgi:hypothetical protein